MKNSILLCIPCQLDTLVVISIMRTSKHTYMYELVLSLVYPYCLRASTTSQQYDAYELLSILLLLLASIVDYIINTYQSTSTRTSCKTRVTVRFLKRPQPKKLKPMTARRRPAMQSTYSRVATQGLPAREALCLKKLWTGIYVLRVHDIIYVSWGTVN